MLKVARRLNVSIVGLLMVLALAKKRGFLIGEGLEFGGEVLDVARVGRAVEDLLDDREEVVQGADRRQRHVVGAA